MCRTMPPSTTSTWPVIHRPAGETNRRRAPHSSEGSPRTFMAARVFIILLFAANDGEVVINQEESDEDALVVSVGQLE